MQNYCSEEYNLFSRLSIKHDETVIFCGYNGIERTPDRFEGLAMKNLILAIAILSSQVASAAGKGC